MMGLYQYKPGDPCHFLERAISRLSDDEQLLTAKNSRGRSYPVDPRAVRNLRRAQRILGECIMTLDHEEWERQKAEMQAPKKPNLEIEKCNLRSHPRT